MPLTPRTSELLARLAGGGIRLGAATTRSLLHALSEPQARVPTVLVAGTNGKGSTAALLAAMATAAGYRTGLFTSPELEDFAEQVRVDGRAASPEALEAAFLHVQAAEGALPAAPTPFEALTAAALLHFAACRCDLTILEAGMGGEGDATNATDPILSILTSVDFDHREYLGTTLEEIATEKAGIFRPGRPALTAPLTPAAAAAVRAQAERTGALLTALAEPTDLAVLQRGWEGQRVAFSTPRDRYELDLPLLGDHQAANLRLAVHAAELLRDAGWAGFDAAAIAAGAARCRWPGRLECVVLPAGGRVLLDAAHNPGGIAVLRDFLLAMGEPCDLLFGVLRDKEVDQMLPVLAPLARRVVLTNPGGPRGRDPEEIRPYAMSTPLVVVNDPGEALAEALRPTPRLLVVCGSLRLVGAVRSRLREMVGVPAPALDL